jgi:hypothetical protein
MPLFTHQNPLLVPPLRPATNLESLAAKTTHRTDMRTAKREIRDARRAKCAAEAVGSIDHDTEIYAFTKGQFSIIEVINHVIDQIGKCFLSISTWTADKGDVTTVLDLVNGGRITGSRWLMDLSFNRRRPEISHRVRTVFGDNAVRVAQNHAKFVLLHNEEWKIVCMTSMNLNYNPRFENFLLRHDPALFDFHQAILDEIWKRQPRSMCEPGPGKAGIAQEFFREMM